MIKPPVCSSLAPLIPRMLQIEGVDNKAFLVALEARLNQISVARFSNVEDPANPQKWVVPGYSGYVIRDAQCIQIFVINPNQTQPNINGDKKRKAGLRYVVRGSRVSFEHIVFKRITTADSRRIENFILTSKHQAVFFRKDPGSVACPPQFLGRWRKGDLYKQEWWEPEYLGTLFNLKIGELNKAHGVWVPFPYDQFVKGMLGIAKHLVFLHQMSICHMDVKIDNIFIRFDDGFKMHLSDYELLSKTHCLDGAKDYYIWDKVKANAGFSSSFSDIYGWTITLADALIPHFFDLAEKRNFGLDLAELVMDRLIQLEIVDDVDNEVVTDEETLRNMDGKSSNETLNFFVKVYHFVKKVVDVDAERDLISKLPKFKEDPVSLLKEKEISSEEFIAFATDLYETAKKIRGSSGAP